MAMTLGILLTLLLDWLLAASPLSRRNVMREIGNKTPGDKGSPDDLVVNQPVKSR